MAFYDSHEEKCETYELLTQITRMEARSINIDDADSLFQQWRQLVFTYANALEDQSVQIILVFTICMKFKYLYMRD